MMTEFILTLAFWGFVFASAVQLAVWWGLFLPLARYRSAPPSMPVVPVSVLVCARNEAQNLQQNLRYVLEQQYPQFEVLVIDDDSADDSVSVLRALQATYPQLRILQAGPKTRGGKKQALAKGIAAARYEHLVFTDADCIPVSPYWLQHIAGAFGTTVSGQPVEIVLGYAPYQRGPGMLNRWVRFETVHTALLYFSFALAGQPYMGVGRNLAWQRRVFKRVGGFRKHLHLPSGDDDLLVNAAAQAGNTALCLAPESFVYSTAEKSWRGWWRQKQRHLQAGAKYRPGHQFGLSLLAISQVLHYFLLATLLFTDFGIISAAIYAVRMASAFPIYLKILCQFRERQLIIWFLLFDALLAVYYAAFVPLSLIRSDDLISWK